MKQKIICIFAILSCFQTHAVNTIPCVCSETQTQDCQNFCKSNSSTMKTVICTKKGQDGRCFCEGFDYYIKPNTGCNE